MPSMPEDLSLDAPLAVIGEEDRVVGFKALGFKVYTVSESRPFRTLLDEVVNNKIGICLVEDDIYKTAEGELSLYKSLPLPVFIPFSKTGDTKSLNTIIKDIRLRATGTIV